MIVPGPIERTGGYLYDCRMVDGLRRLGWRVDLETLRGSFPVPDATARADAARALARVQDGGIALIDGLALAGLADAIESDRERLRIVPIVHLPLGADVSRDAASREILAREEERALKSARLVVVTSDATLPMLTSYALPPDGIVVVEPGTDRAPLAHGSKSPERNDDAPVRMLCVATINGIKNHAGLIDALSMLRERRWHLHCAGSLTRDPATVDRVRRQIADLHLEDRISLVGELDEASLDAEYDRADLVVLATLQETYGMAAAEALARGLPVIGTRTGAIPALVGDEAGALVTPGDVSNLSRALSLALDDAGVRARWAAAARRVRDRLPTWADASGRMSAALEGILARG